jgi:hypothetical protein
LGAHHDLEDAVVIDASHCQLMRDNLDTSLTMRENGSTGQVTVTASGIRCSLGLAEVGLKFLIVAAPPSLPNK